MPMSIKGIGKYFIMILIVMVGIIAVKAISKKVNIPVVSNALQSV